MVKSSFAFSGTILLEVPEWPKGLEKSGWCLEVDDPFRNAWVRLPPSTPPSGGVFTGCDCVALHLVSIRTLDELSRCKLGAGWGSRGESMLPFIGRS
jgi:hypothetical protein